MNIENLKEAYSVWYPATSSDSPSGRSKGVRFASAYCATRKRMNPSGWTKTPHFGRTPKRSPPCPATIRDIRTDSNTMKIPMRESPMETSYDSICADDRSPPRSGYLLPLAHPARTTPYTVIPETANR